MTPKSKIAKNVMVAQNVYKPEKYGPEHIDEQLPNGGMLFESEWDENTGQNEFCASVFLDPVYKKLTYGVSGTRINQGTSKAVADLKDDALLAVGLDPAKMKSMKALNEKILDAIMDMAEAEYKIGEAERCIENFKQLNDEDKKNAIEGLSFPVGKIRQARNAALKGYEIDYTGHSLGAVLADCAAADMYLQMSIRGVDTKSCSISSTTFDNPGALTPVKRLCANHEVPFKKVQNAIKYKVFNNRENFINTLDKQVGEKYQIIPDGQKPRNGFSMMLAWMAKKVRFVIPKKIIKFLSFGNLSSQARDHSISNFNDVLVEGKGIVKAKRGKLMTMEEATTGIEPLELDDERFRQLKSLKALDKKSPEPEFSMTKNGERIEFSKKELEALPRKENDLASIQAGQKKAGTHLEKYQYSQQYKKTQCGRGYSNGSFSQSVVTQRNVC